MASLNPFEPKRKKARAGASSRVREWFVADLNRYIGFAPDNMVYDKSARTYVRGPEYSAHFLKPDASRYLAHGQRRHAERVTDRQRRRHVPADHRAGQHTKLAAETADEVPDLPALRRFRAVQPRRAVRAGLRAGLAVALAPAEGPLGESAEAFFSCSSSRPFET